LVVNSCSSRRTATDIFVNTNFALIAMEMNMDLHSDTHLSYCGCVMIANSLVIWYQHIGWHVPQHRRPQTGSLQALRFMYHVCMCDLHHMCNHITWGVSTMYMTATNVFWTLFQDSLSVDDSFHSPSSSQLSHSRSLGCESKAAVFYRPGLSKSSSKQQSLLNMFGFQKK